MTNTFLIILVVYQWLNILRLVEQYCQKNCLSNRRWHVKPHLRNDMRDTYGAYETTFLYYANCDEEGFFKMTRMNVNIFHKLYNILHVRLLKTSLRKPLSGELRLALTLNYLAHGDSVFTTADYFRVGLSTVYAIVAEVCPLIWELLSPTELKWKSAEGLKVDAQGFRVIWNLPNCFGCMDGKEIRVKAPPHSGRSVSDLCAFRNTNLYQLLQTGEANLPDEDFLPNSNIRMPFFLIGDEIFELKKYLMKPYSRNNLVSETQSNFNERLSGARHCIERTFGMMTGRWTILKNQLDFKLDTSMNIVQACLCLHNFIVNNELVEERGKRRYSNFEDNTLDEEVSEDEEIENVDENVSENVYEQRNILADYLASPEGARRY